MAEGPAKNKSKTYYFHPEWKHEFLFTSAKEKTIMPHMPTGGSLGETGQPGAPSCEHPCRQAFKNEPRFSVTAGGETPAADLAAGMIS
ncbi:hypothetical protein JOQ06_023493 [Pogonophryne albipinna]|uniref:Uncharacterized protein n=1 Tax=Pogonophryne albipinna TaxID=1090488 RepID=A0AAD6FSV7_9TELE|nr:hypothetical protein JOQ06_023493 [Pogonophryne albipinna]